mmetsp:Transcript_17143/g.15028  ORF Transcript_17143/g.15028 Transcript_17143/m.15028 type:complete len:221 (-) Transcript_17143:370-1032(-)
MNRNKVSPKQFRQVLATVNFKLSDREFNAITRYYQSDEDENVRYVDFIKDTGSLQVLNVTEDKQFLGSQTTFDNKYQTIYLGLSTMDSKAPVDFNILFEKIKNQIKNQQLRPDEYFRDFDGLRKGTLTYNKFRGVLSKMKMVLSEEELQALEQRFKVNSNEYPPKVNYEDFLREINLVFTQTGLEKDPLAKPKKYETQIHIDPSELLTAEEEEEFHQYMI